MFALMDVVELVTPAEAKITAAKAATNSGAKDLDHALRLLGQAKANAAAVVEGSSPHQFEVLRGEALLSGALLGLSRLSRLYRSGRETFGASRSLGTGFACFTPCYMLRMC